MGGGSDRRRPGGVAGSAGGLWDERPWGGRADVWMAGRCGPSHAEPQDINGLTPSALPRRPKFRENGSYTSCATCPDREGMVGHIHSGYAHTRLFRSILEDTAHRVPPVLQQARRNLLAPGPVPSSGQMATYGSEIYAATMDAQVDEVLLSVLRNIALLACYYYRGGTLWRCAQGCRGVLRIARRGGYEASPRGRGGSILRGSSDALKR